MNTSAQTAGMMTTDAINTLAEIVGNALEMIDTTTFRSHPLSQFYPSATIRLPKAWQINTPDVVDAANGRIELDRDGYTENVLLSKDLGLALQQWHSSGGDPVYAAGSTAFAGKPMSIALVARCSESMCESVDFWEIRSRDNVHDSEATENRRDLLQLLAIMQNLLRAYAPRLEI